MKSIRRLLKTSFALVAMAAVVAPVPSLACAACTGRTDSPLAVGMNWGILTLLGFVLTVLSCLAAFFVHVARRSPPEDDDANSSPPVA